MLQLTIADQKAAVERIVIPHFYPAADFHNAEALSRQTGYKTRSGFGEIVFTLAGRSCGSGSADDGHLLPSIACTKVRS